MSKRSDVFLNKWVPILWPLLRWLFHVEFKGIEHIPKTGPFILVANHNSGALIESHSLVCLSQYIKRKVFGLNHPALFKIPFVSQYFSKIGAITASKEASYEVVRSGHGLLIFPGGNRQALRPYYKKNQNDFPWANGWAEIACQVNQEMAVPVIPVKFIGSHKLNPIFHSSRALSNWLVLPRLLGVKWFPISLAQILFAGAVVGLGIYGGHSPFLYGPLAYLTFLFTVLVPILPGRVLVKIYPPLISSQDGSIQDQMLELKRQMSLVMQAQDFSQGQKRSYPLNSIEKFMIYHESQKIHYNSQVLIHFESSRLDKKKLIETTERWIQEIPQVRSVLYRHPLFVKREIYKQPWFQAKDLWEFKSQMSQQEMDEFCHRPFDLAFDPPIRWALFSEGSHHKVVFSCHHSAFDGYGQAMALQVWTQLYNNTFVISPYKNLGRFSYTNVMKRRGWVRAWVQVFSQFQLKPSRLQLPLAYLNHTESEERGVSAIDFPVPNLKTIRKNFYSYCVLAFDRLLSEKAETKPLLFYLPVGLRAAFKAPNTLQNAVVTHNLFVKREGPILRDSIQKKIQKKLKTDVVAANEKFLFGVLPLCHWGPSFYLKKMFRKLDNSQQPVTCSGLLVNAAMPSAYEEPLSWKNCRFSARGTLYRSPSVGVVLTGKPGAEMVTIEYIPALVLYSDVMKLKEFLLSQILQDSCSSLAVKKSKSSLKRNSRTEGISLSD